MRGFVEFINKETGEPISIPASLISICRSRDEIGDIQTTSVKYDGHELDITDTYDEFCYKMRKAGYKILFSEEYVPKIQ